MLDLGQIVGFDWDRGNSLKSGAKHAVLPQASEQVFADGGLVIADDVKHSQAETRYHALGRTADGRFLHVTFTLRGGGTQIRVISARTMNRKERAIYEQKA
jgi:uncharacterized DUF497 family protein